MRKLDEGNTEHSLSNYERHPKPTEDAKLYSVLSHITLGIVGIIILLGLIKSVKGDRFAITNALTAIFNGLIAIITMVVWHLIYLTAGSLAGPQLLFDIYRYGMIVLILIFFISAFISSVLSARGSVSKIPWAYPITKALLK
jgi:hypothetical protein